MGEVRRLVRQSLHEGKVRVTPERKTFKSWAGLSHHFIRFSHEQGLPRKLPKTSSPVFYADGLWAYLAEEHVVRGSLMQKVEFSDDSDYALLLRARDPSKLLDPEKYDVEAFVSDVKKLDALGHDITKQIADQSFSYQLDDPVRRFARAGHEPHVALMMVVGMVSGHNQRVATKTYLSLGYDGVSDRNGFMIAPEDYETSQAIFFDLAAVELVDSIKNPCKYVERLP